MSDEEEKTTKQLLDHQTILVDVLVQRAEKQDVVLEEVTQERDDLAEKLKKDRSVPPLRRSREGESNG